jgi:hypothetical protein
MKPEEIIAMAKEAGCIPYRHSKYWEDVQIFATPNVLLNFAKLIAEAERHACAMVAEEWLGPTKDREIHIAKAIRARGQA